MEAEAVIALVVVPISQIAQRIPVFFTENPADAGMPYHHLPIRKRSGIFAAQAENGHLVLISNGAAVGDRSLSKA